MRRDVRVSWCAWRVAYSVTLLTLDVGVFLMITVTVIFLLLLLLLLLLLFLLLLFPSSNSSTRALEHEQTGKRASKQSYKQTGIHISKRELASKHASQQEQIHRGSFRCAPPQVIIITLKA